MQEITKLDSEVLKKFKLEANFYCDPNHSENLLFLSPLVLLQDGPDLKKGGFKDTGAKKILGRLTKDILERKDDILFEIPEVIYLHMGYGKKSVNKKGKLAVTAEEGKLWRSFLDLSRFASRSSGKCTSDNVLEEGEPMEVSFPTEEDTETHDSQQDVVPSGDSGLLIPLKGRYILLFSILLIFFEKKKKGKVKENHPESKEAKIGLNKISDFMLFWILPYLLNFNHRKVQEVKKHHEVRGVEFLEFVKRSASEVIKDSFASCNISDEHREVILKYYKKYYGTEQLDHYYDLFKASDNTPLVLVPKQYIIKGMPATLEDIGQNWRKIGRDTLFSEFINLFIKDREIQEDFLFSLKDLKHRQGIDFAIILPDEPTFNELTEQLERECADTFRRPRQTGRSLISPRIGLIEDQEKDLTVCFSFFQGRSSPQVSSLFRAVGAHYMDHFTLAVLHGLCCNSRDPDFRVGNLYGVSSARKCSFKGRYLYGKSKKEDDLNFSQSVGRFCRAEFPETYAQWEETVREDDKVKKLMADTKESLKVDPEFIRVIDLPVMYSNTSNSEKLRKPYAAALACNEEKLKRYKMRVVNLNGCLLSRISQCGRKDNTAVVLAIKDTCQGCDLPHLQGAIKMIITHFIRAVVVAGLPKVYPVEPDAEDRENVECDDSSSDEDLDDDQVEQASSNTVPKKVKEGCPSGDDLEALSRDIVEKWKALARRLRFSESQITIFDKDHVEYTEKPYHMLLGWKEREASSATYKVLFDALCHDLVRRRDLAENLCCC